MNDTTKELTEFPEMPALSADEIDALLSNIPKPPMVEDEWKKLSDVRDRLEADMSEVELKINRGLWEGKKITAIAEQVGVCRATVYGRRNDAYQDICHRIASIEVGVTKLTRLAWIADIIKSNLKKGPDSDQRIALMGIKMLNEMEAGALAHLDNKVEITINMDRPREIDIN